jgi:WD40 repeat protein
MNIPEGNANNIKKAFQNPPILWTADWSPDGKYYAIGGNDGRFRIFNANDNKLWSTHTLAGAIQCLDWNADGKLLAIAIDGQPVQIYNVETKNFLTRERWERIEGSCLEKGRKVAGRWRL